MLNVGDYSDYQRRQRNLPSGRSPDADLDFQAFMNTGTLYAFVHNSRFLLQTCNPEMTSGKRILIRPRRFGKSTFGCLWLEFFRGNKELFVKLEIKSERVPEPGSYVCVHLSLSGLSPSEFVEAELLPKFNEALTAVGLPEIATSSMSLAMLLSKFSSALKKAGKTAAIFIDEYDHMVINSKMGDYQESLSMTTALFTSLKAKDDVIKFVLVTGSSRIAISGI